MTGLFFLAIPLYSPYHKHLICFSFLFSSHVIRVLLLAIISETPPRHQVNFYSSPLNGNLSMRRSAQEELTMLHFLGIEKYRKVRKPRDRANNCSAINLMQSGP